MRGPWLLEGVFEVGSKTCPTTLGLPEMNGLGLGIIETPPPPPPPPSVSRKREVGKGERLKFLKRELL